MCSCGVRCVAVGVGCVAVHKVQITANCTDQTCFHLNCLMQITVGRYSETIKRGAVGVMRRQCDKNNRTDRIMSPGRHTSGTISKTLNDEERKCGSSCRMFNCPYSLPTVT